MNPSRKRSLLTLRSEIEVKELVNFKLTIQYDGTDFHGWQIQDGLRTVQGELTRALSLIEGQEVIVHGSGRTDAGVHAEGQVANVALERQITPEKLRQAINGNLTADVRVNAVEVVPDHFHARYSAERKEYVYRIVRDDVVSPFWYRFVHQEKRPLDLNRMRACSEPLLGEHDWTAFSAAQSDTNSRIRTIANVELCEVYDERTQTRLVEIRLIANGFLRYMARSISGTLLAAGRGEIDAEVIQKALITGDRALAGPTGPAKGLTLVKVSYPPASLKIA